MKRVFSIILIFTASVNLYCDDFLEDISDFIFDDLARLVGIVVMIAAVVYFVKKFIKEQDDKGKSNANTNSKSEMDKETDKIDN